MPKSSFANYGEYEKLVFSILGIDWEKANKERQELVAFENAVRIIEEEKKTQNN